MARQYEAVFVFTETKQKLKVRCKKEGKTFDELLNSLIKTEKLLTK